MGNQDPNIDIRIKTTGGEQAARDITKPADELKKFKGASDAAASSAGKLTAEQRKMADGFKKVGQEIPAFGALLQTLKNPWNALGFAIAACVVAIQNFLTKIDEMAQEIRKFDSINLALKNWATNTAEAAASNREFAESINAIIKGMDDAEKRFNKKKDAIGATFGIERDLAEKTKAFELAQIDKDVQEGRMTPEEGARAKSAIESRHTGEERDRVQREITARKTAAALGTHDAAADRAAAEAELPGLEAGFDKAGQNLKRRQKFQVALESYASKERPSLVDRIQGEDTPWGKLTEWALRNIMGEELSPREQLAGLDLNLDQAGALVVNAKSEFDSAGRALGAGRARVSGAVSSQVNLNNIYQQERRNLGRAQTANQLTGRIEDAATGNDPGPGPWLGGPSQGRYDAQRGAMFQAEVRYGFKAIVEAVKREGQAAAKEIEQIHNNLRRESQNSR